MCPERWIYTIRLRLRSLFRRQQMDQELDDELRSHVEQKTEQYLAKGLNPVAAGRRAMLDMGGIERSKEECRDMRKVNWLHDLVQDLQYGARVLRKNPGFTVVAVLTLGLGIGANTAIFSVTNAAMLRSLPVNRPEELVILTRKNGQERQWNMTHALWEQIRDHQNVLAGLFAYATTRMDLTTGSEERRVPVGFVSGGFFSTLGVSPAIGRTLTDTDDHPGCPAVAVVSHGFWQSEYGSSEDVVGKTVSLDGHPFSIVGVAAPPFFGLEFGYHVPVWVPFCAEAIVYGPQNAGLGSRRGRLLVGRPKPGLTHEQLTAQIAALAPAMLEATVPPNLTAEARAQYLSAGFEIVPFAKGIPALRETYGKQFFLLMVVVGIVLLIACANVANLLLARETTRRHEMAVRVALGGSRFRLIRQLLTESALLAGMGAAMSMLFASWWSGALVSLLSTPQQNISLDLPFDTNVLAFALVASLFTAMMFGLAPAWRAVRVDPYLAMRPGARGPADSNSGFRVGKALIVGQVALSLVAVVAATLLLDSWRRLACLDPGFQRDHVLLVGASTRAAQFPADRRRVLYRQVIEGLRAIPGVRAASAAVRTPIGSTNWNILIDAAGSSPRADAQASVQVNEVSEGYFATLRTPLARSIGCLRFRCGCARSSADATWTKNWMRSCGITSRRKPKSTSQKGLIRPKRDAGRRWIWTGSSAAKRSAGKCAK